MVGQNRKREWDYIGSMLFYTIEVKLVIIKTILASVYDGKSPGKPLKITKKYIRKKW